MTTIPCLRALTILFVRSSTITGFSIFKVIGGSGEPFDLALGFRRLSLLDLSPAEHQPMVNADGRLWIIFNGEIYNHLELRPELKSSGHHFRSDNDTEIILAAKSTMRS
jgi:asparagine synthetase B (glutamine-hydrolysing)